jgi:hypothetical protein
MNVPNRAPDAEVLKEWHVGPFTCRLWREGNGPLRGCVLDKGQPIGCAEVPVDRGVDVAARAVEALVPVLQPFLSIVDGVPITDIVLVLRSNETPDDVSPLERPFALADDLRIVPVDRSTAQMVMAACDSPGENGSRLRVDLRTPLYAIERLQAPRDPLKTWDSDERLQRCIALGRLVRSTSIGFEYSVRMLGSLQGVYEIVPGAVRGFGAQAWTSTPECNWFSVEDMAAWRELLHAEVANPLPPQGRAVRALWYLEYAARTQLLDIRWTLVATAVEILVSTNPDLSTRHFTKRLPQLAAYLGLPQIAAEDASRMWQLRSALSHGSKFGGLGSDRELYRAMERTAREAVRRAIVEPATRAIFDQSASVDAAFPVTDPPARTVKCPTCSTDVTIPR